MKIFIGDIDSEQNAKTEMPMLGGFLQVEPFRIENKSRTISGKLVKHVTAEKKRFVFIFNHIQEDDYATWIGEQRLDEYREIEIEQPDGETYDKYTVDFVFDHQHLRSKVNIDPWLYDGVVFVLEEV